MKKIILIAALTLTVNQTKTMIPVNPTVTPGLHSSTLDLEYLKTKYGEDGWRREIADKDLPIRNSFRLNRLIEVFTEQSEKTKQEGRNGECYHEAINEFSTLLSYLLKLTKEEVRKDQFLGLLKKSQDKMYSVDPHGPAAEEILLYFALAQTIFDDMIRDLEKYDPKK